MAKETRKTKSSASEEAVEEKTPEETKDTASTSGPLTSPLSEGRLAFFRGEYEVAAAHFDAVLADESYDGDSRAKAAYWRAEALLQAECSKDKIALFEDIGEQYANHYLGSAAKRRAEALHAYFAAFEDE